ncbi:MAG: DUF554 domain-containing protein [Clostridia bacterium]|nr:DUF554 domain-containing protein [Clostridia bacterium]
MTGTIVNVIAVVLGSSIGLVLKKGIPQRFSDSIMKAVALCVIYIGIDGCMQGENTLITIISMVLGVLIGELLRLDDGINTLGKRLESKVSKNKNSDGNIARGFVTASLLFCVGAMTIVGSLESGISGNHEILFSKSLLDFISSIIFSASLGIGVMFSAIFVFVYQGAITLLAQFIGPYLGDVVIAEMTCVGSLLIIALGLNMLGITKLKVMNYIPAVFLPIILCLFM